MARRRKDLVKRRKLQENQVEAPSVPGKQEPPQKPDQAQETERVLSTPESDFAVESREARPPRPGGEPAAGRAGWLNRNKENLLLGLLVLYVVLLGLGTAGELFEIEWILNLPIFR